jgi:hypothetical protein
MALQFSEEVMRAMGFRPFRVDEVIKARFRLLKVFSIEGFTVTSTQKASTALNGRECAFAIAGRVNEACRSLLCDDYTDDEAEWERERRCSGPYVLVSVGPTNYYEASSGHLKTDDSGRSVETFDSFREAQDYIRASAREVLPELTTALACSLAVPGKHFALRSVDECIVGTTPEGQTVHDIVITMSGRMFASVPVSEEDLSARMRRAAQLASQLNRKAARFFDLALFEDDVLKRFLYFFLAVEIETHGTFGAMNHKACVSQLVPPGSPAREAANVLLVRQTDGLKNLRDRFVWCALFAWRGIDDSDVLEFKRLKDVRDAIAHGTLAVPPPEALTAIERLAARIVAR